MSLLRILQVRPETSFSMVQSLHTRMAVLRHSLTHPFPYGCVSECLNTAILALVFVAHSSKKGKQKRKKTEKCSTHQTGCLCLVILFLSSVLVGNFQEAWQMLLRTAPHQRSSCPFLPGFSSSPGRLLVTQTCGAQ